MYRSIVIQLNNKNYIHNTNGYLNKCGLINAVITITIDNIS